MVTQEYLKLILDYNPDTGEFIWKQRPKEHFKKIRTCHMWNAKWVGKKAGSPEASGHMQIAIDGRRYKSHRLAWLYIYGVWPTKLVDHANGITDDNRIKNLREASRSQNAANSKKPRNNTSGFKGVCWDKSSQKWHARITVNKKEIHIGHFDCAELAHLAYSEYAAKLQKQFARID